MRIFYDLYSMGQVHSSFQISSEPTLDIYFPVDMFYSKNVPLSSLQTSIYSCWFSPLSLSFNTDIYLPSHIVSFLLSTLTHFCDIVFHVHSSKTPVKRLVTSWMIYWLPPSNEEGYRTSTALPGLFLAFPGFINIIMALKEVWVLFKVN